MASPTENQIAYRTIIDRIDNRYARQDLNVRRLKDWLTEASKKFDHELKLPASININQLIVIKCIEEGLKNIPSVGKGMVLYDFLKAVVSADEYNKEIKKQAKIGRGFIKLTGDLNSQLLNKLMALNTEKENQKANYKKFWEAGQLAKKDSDSFLKEHPLPTKLPDTNRQEAVKIFEKEFWRWFMKNHVTVTIWSAQWSGIGGYRQRISGTYYSVDGVSQHHVSYLRKRFPNFFPGCTNPKVGGKELKILLSNPWNAKRKHTVCSQDPLTVWDSRGRAGRCMAPAPFKS